MKNRNCEVQEALLASDRDLDEAAYKDATTHPRVLEGIDNFIATLVKGRKGGERNAKNMRTATIRMDNSLHVRALVAGVAKRYPGTDPISIDGFSATYSAEITIPVNNILASATFDTSNLGTEGTDYRLPTLTKSPNGFADGSQSGCFGEPFSAYLTVVIIGGERLKF